MQVNSVNSPSWYSSTNNFDKSEAKPEASDDSSKPSILHVGCLHIDPSTGKLSNAVTDENSIMPANFDKNNIHVEEALVRYDYDIGGYEFVTYNSKGQINKPGRSTDTYSGVFSLSERRTDSQQQILKDIDSSFPSDEPLSVKIPEGGETLAEYDKQSDEVEAENEKMKSEYEAALHKYDGYSTPIADSMNSYLSTLQNVDFHTASKNLSDVPTGDGNYLAESIAAYDKAKTEIENTYSSDSIAKRAKEQGVIDIDSYTKEQQTEEKAEQQKLELYYAKQTGQNIDAQANSLNIFFNAAKIPDDPNSQDISNSIVSMEKQLFSLYNQFKQENNLNYSNESIQDIAKKFKDYSSDKVTSTVDISGTKFTYKDIVSAGEVLNDAFAVSPSSNTIDAYHAALGTSEVTYVAKHDMTSSAGLLLSKVYNEHVKQQENEINKTIDSEYFSTAYSELKNLNINSAENFKNSFNNVLQRYFQNPYDNSYTNKFQTIFNTFTEQFLN